jgi:hypothetical protein
MEPLLTLVIALGGIATGIGAIWTAVVTRHLARATQESLAEQRQSLREQNERARLNLEVDLLHRLEDRYDSQLFVGRRSAAARYYLDNAFVGDDMVGVERLNEDTIDVCNFFESLAYLQEIDVLSAKSVWNVFGPDLQVHWALCKPAIEKQREEEADPILYEGFERLSRLMADMERERGSPDPTPDVVRRGLEQEVARGQEPPTSPERGHLPKRG